MSEHQLIALIRSRPRLSRMFNQLTNDQRRRVLEIANGDDWHLDEIIEFVSEED